jgi:serine-type D-Ala-D-Ala carboxypeptidase (penicillin-binding protein 5/6)
MMKKRIYISSSRRRDPAKAANRVHMFVLRNWKKTFSIVSIAAVALFVVSALLALSDAHLWPAVAESVIEIETEVGQVPAQPPVAAAAAVLTDGESGRVLFEKNAHARLPMASTTKMMTALVVRDQLELEDQVTISQAAADVGEQEIWLEAGETLSVEQLLWALLVHSANDAAFALAEYTTGGIESFAGLMNKKAARIGATESHFTNPHGLDEPEHYSTAYDLAVIGRELLRDPVLAEMVACSEFEIDWPGRPYPRICLNHNEILEEYPDATGIKTGFTGQAGRCLVASATRDHKSLVAVALNSEYRSSDVASLFDYGFLNTERVVLSRLGERVGVTRVSAFPRRYVKVEPEEELAALSLNGSGDKYTVASSVVREARAPVDRGEVLGEIDCSVNQQPVYRSKAVAAASSSPAGLLEGVLAFLWYTACWAGKILAAPVLIW